MYLNFKSLKDYDSNKCKIRIVNKNFVISNIQ